MSSRAKSRDLAFLWGYPSAANPSALGSFARFLFAAPALELVLTIDFVCYIIEAFLIDKTRAVVIVGEAREGMLLTLPDAFAEIVGHADVEGAARGTLHHVDVLDVLVAHGSDHGKHKVPRLRKTIRLAHRFAALGMTIMVESQGFTPFFCGERAARSCR